MDAVRAVFKTSGWLSNMMWCNTSDKSFLHPLDMRKKWISKSITLRRELVVMTWNLERHMGRWDLDMQNQHNELHTVIYVSMEKRSITWETSLIRLFWNILKPSLNSKWSWYVYELWEYKRFYKRWRWWLLLMCKSGYDDT